MQKGRVTSVGGYRVPDSAVFLEKAAGLSHCACTVGEQSSPHGREELQAAAEGLTGVGHTSLPEPMMLKTLAMPSSPHSTAAPRQEVAGPVSLKVICVIAPLAQCLSTLPNRFVLKVYRSSFARILALGPFAGGGEEQTPCPTLPSSHPHLSRTLSHLDCLWGKERGEECGCWKLC